MKVQVDAILTSGIGGMFMVLLEGPSHPRRHKKLRYLRKISENLPGIRNFGNSGIPHGFRNPF